MTTLKIQFIQHEGKPGKLCVEFNGTSYTYQSLKQLILSAIDSYVPLRIEGLQQDACNYPNNEIYILNFDDENVEAHFPYCETPEEYAKAVVAAMSLIRKKCSEKWPAMDTTYSIDV